MSELVWFTIGYIAGLVVSVLIAVIFTGWLDAKKDSEEGR